MKLSEIIGERLINLRKERGVNAVDLAKALEVSKSTISQIEKGIIYPSVINIVAIADMLNTSVDYLVGRSDDPERH